MDVLQGVIFALAASACWATTDFFAMPLLRKHGVPTVFFLMQAVGLAMLIIPFAVFFGMPSASAETWGLLALCGMLNTLTYILYFKGLEIGKLSIIAPISSTWVVPVVLAGTLLLGEHLSPTRGVAIFLVIAGVLLASFKLSDLLSPGLHKSSAGVNFALATVALWSIQFTVLSVLTGALGWFVPVFFLRLFSVLFISIYLLLSKGTFMVSGNRLGMASIGLLDAVAFLLYGLAMTSAYTSIVAPVSATYPVFAAALAFVFLKERIDANQIIGVLLTFIGIYLVLSG
jgi:transporter family protein